jgi:selenocysteine lyase/cysteine desulfurase
MKKHFSLSIGREGAPLHAAAHSHHAWPDVTRDAQIRCWDDAARLLDNKWGPIFDEIMPKLQGHIARQLSLPDPATIAVGPNTHSFVLRLFSCFPADKPIRILTTGSEFMSFTRQCARLEEDRLADVTRVPTEPFDTFEARFAEAAAKGGHDLVFVSQVFFDSSFRVTDLKSIVDAVPHKDTLIVIDGYHAFMAVPTDLSAIGTRVFYLAGGYKYAMAGEGVCFLHCPPGYGPRPRDTGWYAGFSALSGGKPDVQYGEDGTRFLGATFDVSGLYRFNAVQDWLAREGLSVDAILAHVRGIERAFLDALPADAPIGRDQLMLPDETMRGRFLTFRTGKAGEIAEHLAARNVIVDYRGDRLRFGFAIYHSEDDARTIAAALKP